MNAYLFKFIIIGMWDETGELGSINLYQVIDGNGNNIDCYTEGNKLSYVDDMALLSLPINPVCQFSLILN